MEEKGVRYILTVGGLRELSSKYDLVCPQYALLSSES